jgi:hypothetical protein
MTERLTTALVWTIDLRLCLLVLTSPLTLVPTLLLPRSFILPFSFALHFKQSDLTKRLLLFVRLTMRLPHSRQTTFDVFILAAE